MTLMFNIYVSFYVIQIDNILFNKLGALTHSILLSTDASPYNGDEYEQELGLRSPLHFSLKINKEKGIGAQRALSVKASKIMIIINNIVTS